MIRMRSKGRAISGFTLLEVLLAVTTVLILMAALGVYFATASSEQKAMAVANDVSQLITNVRQAYSGDTTYVGLTGLVAVQRNLVPRTLIGNATTGTLLSPWGLAVRLAPTSITSQSGAAGVANTAFRVELDMPANVKDRGYCATMVSSLAPSVTQMEISGQTPVVTAWNPATATRMAAVINALCTAPTAAYTIYLTDG